MMIWCKKNRKQSLWNALCASEAVGLPVPIVVYGEKLVRQEECILIMDLETLVQVLGI